jgi:hypothetical protein
MTMPVRKKRDDDAVEIGKLYAQSNSSFAEAVLARLECGRRLLTKKQELEHGEWLPWLKANKRALGFSSDRTARMLMRGAKVAADLGVTANRKQAADLGEGFAIELSRKMWGHSKAERKWDAEMARKREHFRKLIKGEVEPTEEEAECLARLRGAKKRELEKALKEVLNRESRQQADYLDAVKAYKAALEVATRCISRFSPEARRFVARKHDEIKGLMDTFERTAAIGATEGGRGRANGASAVEDQVEALASAAEV